MQPPKESTYLSLHERAREVTAARLLLGRSGPAYRTNAQLELRSDHASAVDAVKREISLVGDLGEPFVRKFGLVEVSSLASSRQQYLLRPDLGRLLKPNAERILLENCAPGADIQIAIGDGLSSQAIIAQVPELLPILFDSFRASGYQVGQTFFIRNCRVGVLNEIGRVLQPKIVILLIGERPGLATAESMSAYMAYQPQPGHTDANRNLISNIHRGGVSARSASERIFCLAEEMLRRKTSGVEIKEIAHSRMIDSSRTEFCRTIPKEPGVTG